MLLFKSICGVSDVSLSIHPKLHRIKTLVLGYKRMLEHKYAIRSANYMIAALNAFLRFIGWHDLCVK